MQVKITLTIEGFGEGKTKDEAIQSALDSAGFQFFTSFEKDDIMKCEECEWEWIDGMFRDHLSFHSIVVGKDSCESISLYQLGSTNYFRCCQ